MNRLRRAVRQLEATVYRIISQRRPLQSDTGDLLSMLMAARDEDGRQMSDRQLRDEVLTFLMAGHETTALALTWAWHVLGQHPEVERRLHQELDRVLGPRLPGFSDLPGLAYSERVIKETLRLYPPTWSVARTVRQSFQLRDYTIPAGANVVMSQWIVHRQPAYFPDPERFDPDRWLPERSAGLPRFAYFPFGGGSRQCIGASFAMMETTLLLATIARRFRFRAVQGQPVVPFPTFTLRPKYGLPMLIEQRVSRPAVSSALETSA
jgi:cytochrome P450